LDRKQQSIKLNSKLMTWKREREKGEKERERENSTAHTIGSFEA